MRARPNADDINFYVDCGFYVYVPTAFSSIVTAACESLAVLATSNAG